MARVLESHKLTGLFEDENITVFLATSEAFFTFQANARWCAVDSDDPKQLEKIIVYASGELVSVLILNIQQCHTSLPSKYKTGPILGKVCNIGLARYQASPKPTLAFAVREQHDLRSEDWQTR